MAFLRDQRRKFKLSNILKKPSPTYHTHIFIPDFARDSDDISSGTVKMSSLFASFLKELGAGMTVEASIVLPLFLFFFINLASSIEMIRLHGNLQLALWETGNELAVYGYVLESGEQPDGGQSEGGQEEKWWGRLSDAVFSSVLVKSQLVYLLGEDYLDTSPLRNGADSLMLWESEVFGTEDTIDLVVTYSVAPWIKTVGFLPFRMANRYYGHIWNGYAVSGQAQVGEAVYVAENGQVYHMSRDCTHLRLSVKRIDEGELNAARNNYGKRYRACERCVRGKRAEIIYITGEGDKYHYNRDCPGLKRTVSLMLKSDAEKRYRPCSRCGVEKSS